MEQRCGIVACGCKLCIGSGGAHRTCIQNCNALAAQLFDQHAAQSIGTLLVEAGCELDLLAVQAGDKQPRRRVAGRGEYHLAFKQALGFLYHKLNGKLRDRESLNSGLDKVIGDVLLLSILLCHFLTHRGRLKIIDSKLFWTCVASG